MLTGIPAIAVVAPIGIGIALMEVLVPYRQFARYLKVLTLVIFAYVIGAFFARPDWGQAARATVLRHAQPRGTGDHRRAARDDDFALPLLLVGVRIG